MNYGHREDGARQDNKREADFEGWGQTGPLQTLQGQQPGGGFGLQKSFGKYARAYTVQFALQPPANGCDPTADIHFSVAGQTITRRVSVGNAVSITGLCQAINIQIYDTTTLLLLKNIAGIVSDGGLIEVNINNHGFPNGANILIANVTGTVEANGSWIITVVDANNFTLNGSHFVNAYVSGGTAKNITSQQYAVSCTVTPGTRGSTALPPTLKGVASANSAGLANGGVGAQPCAPADGNVLYPVPQAVGVVSVEVSAISTSTPPSLNLFIDFYDASQTILIKRFGLVEVTYPVFVDVPPNAVYVNITNNDPSAPANVALTWGIDG